MKRFARKMKNIALGKRSRFAVLSLLFIVTFAIPLATSFVHSPAAAAISKQSDYGNPDCSLTTASNISCKFKDGTVVGFGFDKYQNGRFEFTNITSSATKCGSGNGLFEYSSSGIDPSPTISSTSLVLGLKNAAGNCIKFNGTVSVSNPNNVDRNPVIAGLGNSIHGCVDVDTGADCSNDPNATCDTDAGGDAKCDSDELNCQGGSLSWILCPVIKLAQDAANQVDDFITNALNIDVSDIFANNETSGTPQNAYYTAWNSFRIISLALLVIGGLVMVISQALGYEIFDAYTVRRVLPRLLVAVMGIALAWPMLKYFIKFFDVVGFDIRNLIYAPFVPIAQSGHISIGTSLFTWGAVIAGGIFVGFAGLTYILTALLAIFVGFLILVIRRVAIIMLVILSPIAIASYILPNTQRIWKLWRDNFLGLMVMFPIISAFIAAGHVFAAVSLSHTGGAGASTVQQMIGIAAYFVPYFLLPVTFRMASGAIGNIAGFVNDRHRGAFDRLKGVRGNATQRNMQRMRDGERFNNAALNNLTARATTSRFGFGAQGQAAYQQKLEAAAARHAKSEHGMVSQFNDNLLRSQTFANEAEARQGLAEEFGLNEAEINQAIADTKANGGWGQARAVHAAKQLARTGTGYKTLDQATRTAARVAGGNESMLDDLSGSIYYESKGAGRWDLTAGGAGDFSKLAAAEAQSLAGSGTGPSVADYHAATVKASKGADAVTILRGKPQEVETLTQSLGDHARALHLRSQDTTLSAAQRQAATDEFIDTMGQIEQLKQSKSYASQTNQEHVNTLLNDTEDLRTGVLTELLGNDTATVDPTTGRVRFGRSNTDPSLTQAQVDNRNRYEQASAPRQNPNDPNMP